MKVYLKFKDRRKINVTINDNKKRKKRRKKQNETPSDVIDVELVDENHELRKRNTFLKESVAHLTKKY